MKIQYIFFWLIWTFTISFLILITFQFKIPILIPLSLLLAMIGMNTYFLTHNESSAQKKLKTIEKIDLKPIEKKIKKSREEQTKYLLKTFELKMNLDKINKKIGKIEKEPEKTKKELEKITKQYEMAFRDVSRKVLDLENGINDKYKVLGEAILKLKKKK